jgi:small GTP-binding protein
MKTSRKNLIALIGDCQMGKTALFSFFRGEPFPANYVPSPGCVHTRYVSPSIQIAEVPEINVWDTSGDPARREIVSLYCQKIDIAVIVTDGFSDNSVEKLRPWFELVRAAAGTGPMAAFVVVRTVQNEGEGPPEVIQALKGKWGCDVMSVNAQSGEGMEEFVTRLYEICQDRRLHPPRAVAPPPPPQKEGLACKCNLL